MTENTRTSRNPIPGNDWRAQRQKGRGTARVSKDQFIEDFDQHQKYGENFLPPHCDQIRESGWWDAQWITSNPKLVLFAFCVGGPQSHFQSDRNHTFLPESHPRRVSRSTKSSKGLPQCKPIASYSAFEISRKVSPMRIYLATTIQLLTTFVSELEPGLILLDSLCIVHNK